MWLDDPPKNYESADSVDDAINFMKKINLPYTYNIQKENTMSQSENNFTTLKEENFPQLNHEEFEVSIDELTTGETMLGKPEVTIKNLKVKVSVDMSDTAVELITDYLGKIVANLTLMLENDAEQTRCRRAYEAQEATKRAEA